MKIPNIIKTISKALKEQNAKAIVVGGSVRDHFLQLPIKDYDIEVYGLNSIEQLEEILSLYGKVNLVGKSFGVLKFVYQNQEYDFSFPRTENKVAKGHRGFDVKCDGEMSFKQASIRRDFTINAMGYDIEKEEFLDPYGAKEDMEKKLLRHIDDSSFVEDPLRVYRAIQFCARFEYKLDTKTFKLCQDIIDRDEFIELPKERVYTEFQKLLLKSNSPSIGFELIKKLDILKYYPELKAIVGIPQSPRWHPEGDVWVHTMLAIDKMAELKTGDNKRDLKLMFAVLCHDFGKATHTQIEEDRISAKGHELAGVEPTKRFLYRLTDEHKFIDSVALLVEYHMVPSQYFRNRAKNKTIRKLSTKIDIKELVIVARADFLGRTTPESLSGVYKAGDWLLKKAKELDVYNRPPKALIQGRDLISLGLKPSKEFKSILNRVYDEQLNGKISTYIEAIDFVKNENLVG
ncbi:MAG: HD domain-containing protein [Epsilonproteobacteria bacterium]|nr:HD domain-containing protein [Campylobacterota bacterium]